MADFTRIFDILDYQHQKYPQQSALSYSVKGIWKSYSIHDVQQRVNQISQWLVQNGFKKGDTIAIVPKIGNPLWMMLDFGCQQIGMITVPIHPTSTPEEIKFILHEVEARICIAVDENIKEKLHSLFHESHLYTIEEFFDRIEESTATTFNKIEVQSTDIACILYTSGTSGTPKGAVLTHQNIVSNIKSILPLFPLKAGDKVMSFLPFSHIFERSVCYAYLAFGANIFFAESTEKLSDTLKKIKPLFITTVPKTLERMYEYLEEQCEQKNWLRKIIVRWAMKVGEGYQAERNRDILYSIKLLIARWLVLNRWKNALSSKTKYVVVGAAALRPEIGRLFSAAGVLTLSGYGMTEASPFISVNRPEPGMNKFGTVGLPVAGVEIKLGETNENEEGEILVKGPNIMQGYFKRPDLNEEVFTHDGWFRTGDVGKMTDKRFLTITGRKKDLFKTTAGIYIAPQELESHLNSSPFISQCMVYGFNKPHNIAVLVPHFALLQNWCEENAIHWTSPQFMIHNIKVIQKFQQEIDRLNEALNNYKKIKKFILTDAEWTTDNGFLTASLKMIRNRLTEKFMGDIEKLYR